MDWYTYLLRRNYPVGKLIIGSNRGEPVLLCSELHGDMGFFSMLDLSRALEKDGYRVAIGAVKGSWAEAHWNQLMEMAGFEPDDLPW